MQIRIPLHARTCFGGVKRSSSAISQCTGGLDPEHTGYGGSMSSILQKESTTSTSAGEDEEEDSPRYVHVPGLTSMSSMPLSKEIISCA